MKTNGTKKKLTTDLVIDLTTVKDLYGEQNLAETSLFAGGFINFGYWKSLKISSNIAKKTRALSSQRLYEKIFELLSVNSTDSILEIGCGLGNGCVLLHKRLKPKYIIGVDASPSQIERAYLRHQKYLKESRDSLLFSVSSAEHINLAPHSISKAFSVEALQHFDSVEMFLQNVFKILKPGGRLVITTFFSTSSPPPIFFDLFPNFNSGVDKLVSISEFTEILKANGFSQIRHQSIGKFVWDGFDKWIAQTEYKDTWDKNWLYAYQQGWLDYYIFEAEKPSGKTSHERPNQAKNV